MTAHERDMKASISTLIRCCAGSVLSSTRARFLVLLDHREHGLLSSHVADICVVGAGIAGIGLVRRLMGHGKRIVLLESGGIDYEPEIAALNSGLNQGLAYYDLENARLRFFGGTAAIWGGRCAELDDIDFEPREWVRYSGWPFAKGTLLQHYAEARRLLALNQPAPAEHLWRQFGVEPPQFGEGVLSTDFWQFDDAWDRFGFAQNRDLVNHPDVLVYLHASVVGVHLNSSCSAVESVEVASLNGRRSHLNAQMFVLAAGGIENPRILLASRSRQGNGVGNAYDVVGRYFMEHPHARGGRLQVRNLWEALKTFRSSHWFGGARYAACLRPDDRLQREKRILNSSFTPRVRLHTGATRDAAGRLYQSLKEQTAPTRNARTAWHAARSVGRWIKRINDPLSPWLQVKLHRKGLYLSVRAEQAPNPNSRVRLVEEADQLGMPRVALDWQMSEIDKHTVTVLVSELDVQMRKARLGCVEPASWLSRPDVLWEHDGLISLHAIGGYHHMGTTRMATDPRFGVVDAHCRVHGVANLFIAGSSVFATSGWANPTLTTLALSLRLADHLLSVTTSVPQVQGTIPVPVADEPRAARVRERSLGRAGRD